MNEKIEIQGDKPSARRRLVRGVFSAPAIMTLCSGSALAATTSKLSCIVKQNAAAVSPVPSVSATNVTFKRVELWRNAGSTVYYVRAVDLPLLRDASLPTGTQVRQFDPGTNVFVAASIADPGGLVASGNKFAVLRVDSTGKVLTVGATASPTGGSAIFLSCWSSAIL